MPRFDSFQMGVLKEYLYCSYVHDAKIETMNYDREKNSLTIGMVNSAFDVIINLTFEEVQVALSISGNELGDRETVLSLSVEEDYSYLQNVIKVCSDIFYNDVYLLFQMFSGDELHIVSKAVIIESVK